MYRDQVVLLALLVCRQCSSGKHGSIVVGMPFLLSLVNGICWFDSLLLFELPSCCLGSPSWWWWLAGAGAVVALLSRAGRQRQSLIGLAEESPVSFWGSRVGICTDNLWVLWSMPIPVPVDYSYLQPMGS